jgi:hypothetical protein
VIGDSGSGNTSKYDKTHQSMTRMKATLGSRNKAAEKNKIHLELPYAGFKEELG